MAVGKLEGEVEIRADFVFLMLLVDFDGDEVVFLLKKIRVNGEMMPVGFETASRYYRCFGLVGDGAIGHAEPEQFFAIEINDGPVIAAEA